MDRNRAAPAEQALLFRVVRRWISMNRVIVLCIAGAMICLSAAAILVAGSLAGLWPLP
jgi:hypothetical protein